MEKEKENLKKDKVAIVLCGGGALGAYEMGVWRYLKEINFHYDIVTGTSIGALNGALMTTGDYDKALKIWEHISVDKVMVDGVNFNEHFFRGFFSLKKGSRLRRFLYQYFHHRGANITPFKKLVHKMINPKKIQDSTVDFGFVCCSYPNVKEIDIDVKKIPTEDVTPFLLASSACFPIFPIEKINGKKYIDGGFKNNLPIDLAIEMGATKIVAVLLDSFPSPQQSELEYLPFVLRIAPSWSTGTMMDFKQTTIQRNMQLGYNDAMKAFGACAGFRYTFYPFHPLYSEIAKVFFVNLIKHSTRHFEEIDAILRWRIHDKMSELDYFVRAIETFSEFAEVDYLKVYTLYELIMTCWNGVGKYKKDEKVQHHLAIIERGYFNFKGNEKAFVYYIKSCLEKKIDIEFLWYHVANKPRLAIILALCQTIHDYIEPLQLIESINRYED